ncbi:gamma-glutamyl hydrolase-like [Actinia tenebrosa]|uniref:folate gamma-glutamyl hydrolase n=1 Tax=Actinia tenebrosa TaxID=6105 RepID=A0A6P8HFM4_ACTTE|nr:gamma-glutamyl hydrolase-like [Actinia tenebrosa]
MLSTIALILLSISGVLSTPGSRTERPIIGILAETTHGKAAEYGKFYIAASYVKYVEAAGGRVVPIFPNATVDQVKQLFQYINGALFPGGGVSLTKSGYAENGNILYQLAIQASDKGVVFPIWGSCLGFELLTVISSSNKVVFSHLDAENYPTPLNLSEDFSESKMFNKATQDMIKAVQHSRITMNNHQWGVTPENFQKDQSLSSFYRIVSTNKDRKGIEYVSTIEGIKYPIFGVQWHPEKNQFEWSTKESIPHSTDAIHLGQYMANFLVDQARMNDHHFPSQDKEDAALIYNYNPTYTGHFSNFTQCYYF